MRKVFYMLLATILVCFTFNLLRLRGTKAIMELSSIIVGIVYLIISFRFFRHQGRKTLNCLLGLLLVLAACFAIFPLLLHFLNMVTFIVNINYEDILFNYYKAYLNSVIGLALFTMACLIYFISEFRLLNNAEGKRNYNVLISLSVLFAILLLIIIARRVGYRIAYTGVLQKTTLLVSIFLIAPYLFYSGFIKNKLFTALFLILTLTLLNDISLKYLFSSNFSKTEWFSYNRPVRTSNVIGLDTLKTINSFKEIGSNFYELTFFGDYTSVLEANNKKCTEESIIPKHYCSLFAASGDSNHYLFGRSFDNPGGWKCKTMLCRTYPADGYASLSLVRMADVGFDISDDMSRLSFTEKMPLINAVFFPPDGINEKGVVIAMAAVEERMLQLDTTKAFINATYLVREILDHAKNIEEAIVIMKKYNIMEDVWKGSFDEHMLIADASGRSVIAEINAGEFEFIPNKDPWLVTTNDPSYNVTIDSQRKACSRFKIISENLEANKGSINPGKALEILKQVGHRYTEWSAVYDITNKELNVAIDYDFKNIYRFSFVKNNTH